LDCFLVHDWRAAEEHYGVVSWRRHVRLQHLLRDETLAVLPISRSLVERVPQLKLLAHFLRLLLRILEVVSAKIIKQQQQQQQPVREGIYELFCTEDPLTLLLP